jgi:hypothetical protein
MSVCTAPLTCDDIRIFKPPLIVQRIVVQCTKQSGMHWAVDGAEDIIHLRCQRASGRWDELWPTLPASPARLRPAI